MPISKELVPCGKAMLSCATLMRSKLLQILLVTLFWTNISFAAPAVSDETLARGRIATWPGAMVETYAREKYPNAEYVYLPTLADMAQSVRQGRADAFAMNGLFVEEYFRSGADDLEIFGESLGKTSFAFVFARSERGKTLCAQFNAFLAKCRETGELEKLQRKWLQGGDRTFQKPAPTGATRSEAEPVPLRKNGTLSVVLNPVFPPLLYLAPQSEAEPVPLGENGDFAGYEAELLELFCAEYGYSYKATVSDFEAAMAGVATGQFDMGASAVEYRPERGEHFLFSDKTCEADCVIVVRSDHTSAQGFWESLTKKFEATLLREDRWKLLINGMTTTLAITFLSAAFGTLLGFLLCFAYREGHRGVNRLIDFLSRFLQGMPIVVFLMVFYYIIFGGADVGGTVVAIVAFSLLFGFSVFGMLHSGANSIPNGQREAALALGFSERQAFLKFILPQAIRIFFPTYRAEIQNLLKSTAIVGYIAVQDLTKMADIIRARTFDAFTPIIAISVLYLLLAWLLSEITGRMMKRLDPKSRTPKKILPGVRL